MDERRTGSHAHITGLDVLDDFIFLAFIGQFEVLGVEIKCRAGVIGHVEAHLITHSGSDIGLNLLFKVKVGLPAL